MNTPDYYVDSTTGAVMMPTLYYCLSTDTKATGVANGSATIEMDTGKLYFYDAEGNEWHEFGASS